MGGFTAALQRFGIGKLAMLVGVAAGCAAMILWGVAKGVDALAMRIREVAREHDVPIVENVPLARALYAAVEVDETIPREHFEAAAKVIGFVMQKRKKR